MTWINLKKRDQEKLVADMTSNLSAAKEIWDENFLDKGDRQHFGKYIIPPTPEALVTLAIYLDQLTGEVEPEEVVDLSPRY